MKHLLIITLSLCASNIFGQNNIVPNNLKEKELYDFMKIVIKQLDLKKTYGLSIIADTSYMYQTFDRTFLANYLIDSVAVKNHLRFDSLQKRLHPDSIRLFNPYLYEMRKCLSENDILSFLQNKKTFSSFKWRNSELGFNLKNKKEWYTLTVPIFNANKTMAIISVSYSCNLFLCGNGEVVLFKKVNNKWTNVTLSHWDN